MKKYQVFVSSTYEDLKEERKKVIDTLLQMGCFPVAMEHFNASNETQWEHIKKLIDNSDYYVIIVAGKYGSIEPKSGKSYTQLEYEYAEERGVPIFSFCHGEIQSLPVFKVEKTSINKKKLNDFLTTKVRCRLCNQWTTAEELARKVSLSVSNAILSIPRPGWERLLPGAVLSHNNVYLNTIFDFTKIHDEVCQSEETRIFGLGCTVTVKLLYDEYRHRKLPNDIKIRFLFMHPSKHAVEVAAFRQGEKVDPVKKMYLENIDRIKEMHTVCPNIECRVIDYLPPYNLFISNPKRENSQIHVHLAGWRGSSTKGRPIFTITKKEHAQFYKYFLDEFNTLWAEAEIICANGVTADSQKQVNSYW